MASVTAFMRGESVDRTAAERSLFDTFFDSLVRFARKKLKGKPRCVGVGDEEDAALSAIHAVCRQAGEDQFKDLKDRDSLTNLLRKITRDKVSDMVKAQQAKKRGGGKVRGESFWQGTLDSNGDEGGIARCPDNRLPPDLEASIKEESQRLLAALGDNLLQVALWKLEGLTNAEIATELDKSERTIERQLTQIRSIWSQEVGR
jgi:DNA-directed RNA polymerase specialized sigma24 family protein